MTKTVKMHMKDWLEKQDEALRAYRITWKNIGLSPYHLAFGKQLLLPIEFEIHTYRLATKLELDLSEAQQQRILQLNELDEIRKEDVEHTSLVQQQRMKFHYKFIKNNNFHIGEWVLLFDSKHKYFKAKFSTYQLGPHEIEEIIDNGSVRIKTIDEDETSFLVNGHRLNV